MYCISAWCLLCERCKRHKNDKDRHHCHVDKPDEWPFFVYPKIPFFPIRKWHPDFILSVAPGLFDSSCLHFWSFKGTCNLPLSTPLFLSKTTHMGWASLSERINNAVAGSRVGRFFQLEGSGAYREREGTRFLTEIRAGLTTFFAMVNNHHLSTSCHMFVLTYIYS